MFLIIKDVRTFCQLNDGSHGSASRAVKIVYDAGPNMYKHHSHQNAFESVLKLPLPEIQGDILAAYELLSVD